MALILISGDRLQHAVHVADPVFDVKSPAALVLGRE